MVISLSIIIAIAVLLVLALVTPLFSPFFRKVEEEETKDTTGATKHPAISIVLVEHDSSYRLSEVLPALLEQKYDGEYQVVVVIDQNDSESEDICKRYRNESSRLYYTMLPTSSRYISRKKLGITIGMKAAKYDWVLLTDVHSMPSSDEWLAAMASHIDEGKNLVLGMTPYEEDTNSYYRFDQLRTMLYHLRRAQAKTAYITNQSLLMMRKSEFFSKNGFRGNLEHQRAEFEFLVNKFAKENSTAIAIEPEARMIRFEPTTDYWYMRQLSSYNARKSYERNSTFAKQYYIDMISMHIFNILCMISLAIGIVLIINKQANELMHMTQLEGIVLTSGTALAWLASLIERYIIYRPVLETFDNVGTLQAIMLEWTVSIHNCIVRLKYHFSDKDDFNTHKL